MENLEALRMMYEELQHHTAAAHGKTSVRDLQRIQKRLLVLTSCFSGARGRADLSLPRTSIGSVPDTT